MSKPTCAVLLAAGRGTRQRPYTDHTPKPLLAFNDRPTIDYTLTSLQAAGITRVCLVVNHLADQMRAYASSVQGVLMDEVVCAPQASFAGTSDALLSAVDHYPHWFETSFVLAATDYIVPVSFYPDLIKHHCSEQAKLSVSLKRVKQSELAMRSSVRFNQQGLVTEVVEKPPLGQAPSEFSANLVFIMPPEIVSFAKNVTPSPRGEKEIQSAVNEYIKANGPAQSLVQATPQEWQHE